MRFYLLIGSLIIPIIAQKHGKESSIDFQKPIILNVPERAEMREREHGFSSRLGSPFIDDHRSRVMDIDLDRNRHEFNDRSRQMDFERDRQRESDRQREIERDQQFEMERRREIDRDRNIEMERRREIERDREIETQRRREIEREEEINRQEEQRIDSEQEQRRQQEQHEEINREVNKALEKREELKNQANSKKDFLSTRSGIQNNANWREPDRIQINSDSNWRDDIQRDVRHIDPRGDRNRIEEIARERETARIQAERNQEKRERERKFSDVGNEQDLEGSDSRTSRVLFNDNLSSKRDIEDRYSVTGDRDAPILILEQVEVPVPVPVTAHGVDFGPGLPVQGVDNRGPDHGDRNIWYGSGPDDMDRRPQRPPFPHGLPGGPGSLSYGPIPFDPPFPPFDPHFPPFDPSFPPFDPSHAPDGIHVHTYEEGGIRDPRFIGPRLPPPQIAGQLQLHQLAIQNQIGQALLVDQALKHQAAGVQHAAAAGVQQAVATAGVQKAVAAAGVQHAAAAEATATKLHAVHALKTALKEKIKEKLKHNIHVASVAAGQNAVRKQHATDLAVALTHVPQDPTNLALHIAEVKHHYDKTRKELLRRLILLKPYFLRSGSLDYSMPSSLPRLPNGVLNLTPLQVQQLPFVRIQGPLTLVGPPFHLPNSFGGSLGPTIDEKYIEFILKLPDHIFRVITHMTKREFLLTLFPRLYRESVDATNHEKEQIYGPPKSSSYHPVTYTPITPEPYAPVTIPPYTEFPSTNPPYKHPESSYVTPEPSYSHNKHHKPIKFPGEPSSSYGVPPPPSPIHGTHPHAPSPTHSVPTYPPPTHSVPTHHSPTYSVPTHPSSTHSVPTHHVQTIHHEHTHHHHQAPVSSISNGAGHSQKPNIYTSPKSIILPISEHNSVTPMPLYPPVGLESQPRHQTLSSVLQVTTPEPFGEHHTNTIVHQGSNVPVVTATHTAVVGGGVHIRPQGHPLTDHHSKAIPANEHYGIHITTTRPPLSPIAPLIPSPTDSYAPPIVITHVPVTTPYQPAITTEYQPAVTTPYQPAITTPYQPPITTEYQPATTPYQPAITTPYPPAITTPYQPAITTTYKPAITTTNPPISTIYDPVITTTYNPPVTTPYYPINSPFVPANLNNPFIPINTTPIPPVITSYQPPITTTLQPIFTTVFEEFPDASEIPDFDRPIEGFPIDPNVPFETLVVDNFEIDRKRPLGTDSHDDSHRFPIFVKRQGDGSSKEATRPFSIPNFSQQNGRLPSNSRTPMPQQIGLNGLPSSPRSHRRIPGGIPQNPPSRPPRPITEAELASLPAYLRKAPSCASIPTNRSFCLMPDEYPTEVVNKITQKYNRELRELKNILQRLPPIEFDLEKAAEQFASIDKSIKCESEERTVVLSWSRDVLGSWFAIFQTPPLQQQVTVTTCSARAKSLGCRPLLRPRPLVAFHPRDPEPRPLVFEFPMPIACVAVTSDLQSAASAFPVTTVVGRELLPTTFSPSTDLSVNRKLGITANRPMFNEEVIDNLTKPYIKSVEIQHSPSRPLHSLQNKTDITLIAFNIPLDSAPSARQPKSLPEIIQDNLQIDSIPIASDEDKGEVIDLPSLSNESESEGSDTISGGNNLVISNYHFMLILLFISLKCIV